MPAQPQITEAQSLFGTIWSMWPAVGQTGFQWSNGRLAKADDRPPESGSVLPYRTSGAIEQRDLLVIYSFTLDVGLDQKEEVWNTSCTTGSLGSPLETW